MTYQYEAKQLNEGRFLHSGFTIELFSFAKEYDKIFNKNFKENAKKWLRVRDYNSLLYFLKTTSLELKPNTSIEDIALMSQKEIEDFQLHSSKVIAILNEKNELYNYMLKFYN